MEKSTEGTVTKCTFKVKDTDNIPKDEADSTCEQLGFHCSVHSRDIELLKESGKSASLKRKNGGSLAQGATHSNQLGSHRKVCLPERHRDDSKGTFGPVGKAPCIRTLDDIKDETHIKRGSMTESTILEEDLPVIVRRRGCTLRVRITSITDEDLEAFEKECVSLWFCLLFG